MDNQKYARKVNVEIDHLNLPDHFSSTVKKEMNKNNYNVKSQIWVNTKSKVDNLNHSTNISNPSDSLDPCNNMLETDQSNNNKAIGLISYDKKIIYNSKKFRNVLENIIKESNQVGANIVNLDSSSCQNKWIENISQHNNILSLQQDNTNIFVNVEGNIVLNNKKKKKYIPVLKIIDNGLKIKTGQGSDSDEEVKKIKKVQDLKDHIPESQYLSFKRRYEREINERDENERKRIKLQRSWVYPLVTNKYGLGWKRASILCNTVIRKEFNHRKKNLWLHGNSGLGKTKYFLDILIQNLNCYPIMKDKTFNTLYQGPYDLIYCDEFKAQKSAVFLNELCNIPSTDGMLLRIPGGKNCVKYDSPPVFIIANSDIDTIYKNEKNKQIVHALKQRFYEIEVTEQGNIFEVTIDDEKNIQLDEFINNPDVYDEFISNQKKHEELENVMNNPDIFKETSIVNVHKKSSEEEEKCRNIFEQKFGVSFPNIRHSNIINPETNQCLELDGYNEDLKLAFEYQGYQHYYYPNDYHKIQKEFDDQVKRDKIKVERCKELGIRLIIIPYTEKNNLDEFIMNKINEMDIHLLLPCENNTQIICQFDNGS